MLILVLNSDSDQSSNLILTHNIYVGKVYSKCSIYFLARRAPNDYHSWNSNKKKQIKPSFQNSADIRLTDQL